MIIGNCTREELVEEIFGSVTEFAQWVESFGDEFQIGQIKVVYDVEQDIHSFVLEEENLDV